MLEVQIFDLGCCDESEYTRVVCVSKYQDKFVFCYNKKRNGIAIEKSPEMFNKMKDNIEGTLDIKFEEIDYEYSLIYKNCYGIMFSKNSKL